MSRSMGVSFGVLPAVLVGCAFSGASGKRAERPLAPLRGDRSPVGPETAVLPVAPPGQGRVALVGGTLLLGTGARIDHGTVVLHDGRIEAVGPAASTPVPDGARRVALRGRFVTPGLIDTHSHMGVHAVPQTPATADGNEMTDPTTPYVFSEHAFWPQDPAIRHAVAGGVTTILVLPGSANVIGGRAVALKLRPRLEARAMRFPRAPNGLKMACGENPKRVYGGRKQQPMSRMGNVARLRRAFVEAQQYRYDQAAYEAEHAGWKKKYDARNADRSAEHPGKEPRRPNRDLGRETLARVLDGEILVHIHCYRADEMLLMISLADELGFRIRSFHHAVEAYKIADILAKEEVGASMWADWWGFKLEAYDGIEENVAALAASNGRAIVHSDSNVGIQRLNQEAAKALHAGRRLGLSLTEDEAIRWITANPAWALGVDDQTGTLEPGKMADVVVWSENPFSIYALADEVYIDGELAFDRSDPRETWSDFEVGTEMEGVAP